MSEIIVSDLKPKRFYIKVFSTEMKNSMRIIGVLEGTDKDKLTATFIDTNRPSQLWSLDSVPVQYVLEPVEF